MITEGISEETSKEEVLTEAEGPAAEILEGTNRTEADLMVQIKIGNLL